MVESKEEVKIQMNALTSHCFDTIIASILNKDLPKYPSTQPDPEYPIFVTWTMGKDDDLRGCIGTFAGQKLSKILGKYAMISAFRDDRFEPISKTEVPHLSVGVSLLVNFTKIDDPLEWEVGKHGIEIDFTINGREYGSTFLPEVASEQEWDQKTTLEQLVRKAGYRGGFESVRTKILAKTYESLKAKMSYDEYMSYKKSNDEPFEKLSPLLEKKKK